jgi:hypothetical protein
VTGLQVLQAAFSLSHPVLLYKDPYCSQTGKLYWTEEWQWNHELQLQRWELI